MNPSATSVLRRLKKLGNATDAAGARRFIKSGEGQYGEGYRLLGIRTPVLRKLASDYSTLALPDTELLLQSAYHEAKFLALLLLVNHFRTGDEKTRSDVVKIYLRNTHRIDGWDLVDCSAHKILGPWLEKRSRKVLYRLAKSKNLWERRIAIMTTFHFIRFSGANEFSTTLEIAEMLLHDEHDLIHKATGWMLREIGDRDRKVQERFLRLHYRQMPRTMLRYAIEKFPPGLRRNYLQGKVSPGLTD